MSAQPALVSNFCSLERVCQFDKKIGKAEIGPYSMANAPKSGSVWKHLEAFGQWVVGVACQHLPVASCHPSRPTLFAAAH